MPGAGDGEKLGEPLDHAEVCSGKQVDVGHRWVAGNKKAGPFERSGLTIVTRSAALAQRRQRLFKRVVIAGRDLTGRRQLIDDLRQDLREAGACITVRQTKLLRD